MTIPMRPTILLSFLVLVFLPSPSSAQSCLSETFSQNRLYSKCNSLSVLSASLHWNYHASNGTLDIAYRAATQSSSEWVSWAINPTGSGMIGAEALLAFPGSDGTMTVYTTKFSTYNNPTVKNESLSFQVYSREAEYSNNAMTIYATLQVPNNKTTVNQVWQVSNQISNGVPAGHPTTGSNTQSSGTLDLLSGQSATAGNSRAHRKNTHGVLNAVSWGILMPIGAIIARYLKVFKSADPAWFYLHIACQISAYIVGVAGWGTGLKLGSESSGITYDAHRNIGIALFCLATLQVFALLLRPNKDHKYRHYWNYYHWSIGYAVIILSIINIFKGLDILDPSKKWKHAYIGIIATLGGIAVVLEAVTWTIYLKRKSRSSEKSHHGVNGTNGYGGRQQP